MKHRMPYDNRAHRRVAAEIERERPGALAAVARLETSCRALLAPTSRPVSLATLRACARGRAYMELVSDLPIILRRDQWACVLALVTERGAVAAVDREGGRSVLRVRWSTGGLNLLHREEPMCPTAHLRRARCESCGVCDWAGRQRAPWRARGEVLAT